MIDHVYEFDSFARDPQKKSLVRGSETLTVSPKVYETMLLLVENRDRLLSKDELMAALWPDSFVGEANLSQNIYDFLIAH